MVLYWQRWWKVGEKYGGKLHEEEAVAGEDGADNHAATRDDEDLA